MRKQIEEVRYEKLEKLRKHVNPYPDSFKITHYLNEVALLDDGTINVRIAGRIILLRKMGKMSFLTISDIRGKMQIAIKKDLIGEEQYELFKNCYDIGDFIGVEGECFTTNSGEKTIRAFEVVFLGKALKSLPEKFHGLVNIDICYRKRYLDLIGNEDTKKRFLLRSKFIQLIRNYLENNNYIEIETPVLINKPSGALARPFISHHNALDMEVYLRIAPETYLKRAIVGGFDRVYEFARCFRNEGIDSTHLQDFTMLECYCAYYNYSDNMVFIQNMLKSVVWNLFGSLSIKINEYHINFDTEWKVVTFREVILEDTGIDIDCYQTSQELLGAIKVKKISLEMEEREIQKLGRGNLIDMLYKKQCRPKMIQPTFLVAHPVSLSPLARSNDLNPEITDRFQLVINGSEIVNAYSELVDPIVQHQRLLEQAELNSNGDVDAMVMDSDYISAMEYGMPPISGWGMGIDRVIQILSNSENIRDTILFPLMRPLDDVD